MTTVNGANLFKEVENILGQSTSFAGGSSASFNDIAWFSNAVQGCQDIASDNSSKKTSGIQTIMNLVVGFINSKLSAEQETSESNENINEGKSSGEKVQKTTQEQINDIIASVGDNVKSINDALDAIEKLGGDDSEGLVGLQAQLEEQKALIKKAIETLKNSKDEKEVEKALETIKTCQAVIGTLVERVDEITEEINKKTATVENLTTIVEAQQGNAEKILAEGLKAIEGIVLETSKEGITNVSYVAKGGQEVAEGTEIQAAVAAVEVGTLGAGTGVVAGVEKKAIDLIEAGGIHISKGSSNLLSLGSVLGTLGDSMKDVSAYSTAIGSALDAAQEIIGSYSNTAKGLITSTGSWSTIKSANEELDKAVKDYQGENDKKEVKQDTLFNFDVQEKFKLGSVKA